MPDWKCSNCGYQVNAEQPPGDVCPSCNQNCTWLNVTCYIPDCAPQGFDDRF